MAVAGLRNQRRDMAASGKQVKISVVTLKFGFCSNTYHVKLTETVDDNV